MAPFWIVSEFNDLAIDLKQSTKDKVTTHSLMTFDKSPEPVISQMFYEDSSGIIRSCMNDFQIDSSSKLSRAFARRQAAVSMAPYFSSKQLLLFIVARHADRCLSLTDRRPIP